MSNLREIKTFEDFLDEVALSSGNAHFRTYKHRFTQSHVEQVMREATELYCAYRVEQAIADYEKSKWVSVDSEEKPKKANDPNYTESSVKIIICGDGWVETGFYEGGSFIGEDSIELDGATHWQPLPTTLTNNPKAMSEPKDNSQFRYNKEKDRVECKCGQVAVPFRSGYLCSTITAYPCKY